MCVHVRACVRGGTSQTRPPDHLSDRPSSDMSTTLSVCVACAYIIAYAHAFKRIDFGLIISTVKRRVLFVESKKTKK